MGLEALSVGGLTSEEGELLSSGTNGLVGPNKEDSSSSRSDILSNKSSPNTASKSKGGGIGVSLGTGCGEPSGTIGTGSKMGEKMGGCNDLKLTPLSTMGVL